MHKDISRRDMIRAMGWGAAALAAAELGGGRPAWAEDAFTIASTGGSWGDGLKQAYVVGPGFEKRANTQVSYAHMIDSVIATKAIAQCGNPPFTVPALLNAEAVMLADGGCLIDYDLGVVTNYKDLLPGTFEPPCAGLKAYWAAHTRIVMGLVFNTKRVTAKPTSFMDLGSATYKGKIGIPAYGWVGIQWLHSLNQSLGGTPDNIDPGMKAIAELVKKNDAIIMFTTLPHRLLSDVAVLELYRYRWQIELAFKRLKQLLKFGRLPHQDAVAATAWIHAKLLVALLLETLFRSARVFSPWGYDLRAAARANAAAQLA